MSVHVIDTIKPKNNGTFPVVEDVDILIKSSNKRLSEVVATMATQSQIDSLQSAIDNKASQSDLESLQTTVAGKAEQTDLEELSADLANKADASDLTDLATTVSGKASAADLTALESEVEGKADNSDLIAATANLQSQINELITPVTQDAEVQNARVAADGSSYTTLKTRLDKEHEDITENYFEKTIGKNLFNPDSPRLIKNYYVAYNTGITTSSDNYEYYIMYVTPAQKYSFRYKYAQIAFFSGSIDTDYYISGVANENSVTVPSGAYIMTVSIQKSNESVFQIEAGDTYTSYEEYYEGYDASKLLDGTVTLSKLQSDIVNDINEVTELIDSELLVIKEPTKNLIDSSGDYTPITNGYYVQYSTGIPAASETMSYIVIAPNAGAKISINKDNVHVAYFSALPVGSTNYITGELLNASTYGTVPQTAKYLTVSLKTTDIATAQLEYGEECTTYEPFKLGVPEDELSNYNGQKIVNGTVTANKLTSDLSIKLNNAAVKQPLKNLLDASGEYTPITDGKYVPYGSGVPTDNASQSYAVIKTDNVGSHISVNEDNTHIAYFSALPISSTNYISGELLQHNTYGTIPANTKYLTFSFKTANLNTAQIEYGTNSTEYEAFKLGVVADVLANNEGNHVLFVGADKKYTTIQAAVNAATDGDVIFIDPGTYEEAVDINSTGKFLHLIGSGAKATIIKYSGGDYRYPPLEIGEGIIENIGFKTYAIEKDPEANNTSYCVHIDYDNSISSSLTFLNCYFESPIRPTVGIGLRENFTLSFRGCEFKSGTFPVYFHEQQASNKINQNIEFIDCSMENTTAATEIVIQETTSLSGNVVNILFQRCIAKSQAGTSPVIIATTYPNGGTLDGNNYLNTHTYHLSHMSALNNVEVLNA